MGKAYTGFDIGTETLKVVVCDGDSVKDIVLAKMPDGMVADGHVVSIDAMVDFIKDTTKGMKSLSKQAAFIIPQADSLTRRLQIPAMTTSELDINLPYEFRDYITQGKEKYLYDYAVLNTEKSEEGEITGFDLLAVAATKEVMAD
ncbi:MAG: type IV pilus biogenesis protein PilM [Raoultibacter sp.]|jgi:type IV pilus assembly protein PilM